VEKRDKLAMILRLQALESLYNSRGGQRWGWIFALRGTVPVETLRIAVREASSILNVTPLLSGLMIALWRKKLLRQEKSEETQASISSLTSAGSARGDRLFWGEARPTLLLFAIAFALALGAPGAFIAPILWSAGVVGMLWWGIGFGSGCTEKDIVSLLSSPTWDLGEKTLGIVRRVVLGLILGMWLAWTPGGELVWIIAPLLGILGILAGLRSPLTWGAVGLLVALVLGYLVEALNAVP
jgi:mannose/fructose/N-acetylgalactosamine-specific phosphotransferase system component IID